MTALRAQEYDFEKKAVDESIDIENTLHVPAPKAERPEVVVVPYSPSRKLDRISRMEKVIITVIILVAIGLSVLTISIRASINQAEQDITTVQNKIDTDKDEVQQLEQEKSELSKSERIQKIAEKKGLSINSDNLRKVNK